jgi:beta-phosphoglucomutase-like phosphatase (HAD superfamily)
MPIPTPTPYHIIENRIDMRRIEVPDFIKGLIFDCDGTLVDSMPFHMKAWEHAITSNGGRWDVDFFDSKKGMPEEDIVGLYNAHFETKFDPVEMVNEKHRFFRAHALEFKPILHVLDVVNRYRHILPMAVVSGGVRENVYLELEAIHIKGHFKAILTADDDIKPKPAPDIFLEAAKRIGIAPEQCQAFEDGDLGLEAARLAGMLATDVR